MLDRLCVLLILSSMNVLALDIVACEGAVSVFDKEYTCLYQNESAI